MQQQQIPNYIRAFIHPQNQTLLWKIVVENNPQWTAGLFKNNADATANWFKFIIQQTYELEIIAAKTHQQQTTSTLYSDLKQLNQKFLQSIAVDLQKHFQQQSPPQQQQQQQQQQMQYQQQQNNPAVIKQENMFELEKDTPLPNLEELMQQQMKQREEVIVVMPQQQI